MIIKTLVLDVDGTLTDGHIYMGENGEIMKAFWAHDAVGIRRLVQSGVMPIIITGRESNSIQIRANEMNIKHVYTKVDDKKLFLEKLADKLDFVLEETAFMGDDINDLEAMSICGFVACPNNAMSGVKEIADFISVHDGGYGAVREFCDYLLEESR